MTPRLFAGLPEAGPPDAGAQAGRTWKPPGHPPGGPFGDPSGGPSGGPSGDRPGILEAPDAGALAQALSETSAFDLNERFRRLKRRRWMILGTVILLTGATLAGLRLLTPRYTATADLLIEAPRPPLAGVDQAAAPMPFELEAVQAEIAILLSRTLAARVARALALDRVEEFQPLNADPGADPGPGAIWSRLKAVLLGVAAAPANPAQAEERRFDQTLDLFLDGLRVAPVGRSRVVEITFTSRDPERARQIVDALTEAYLRDKVEHRLQTSERTAKWLHEWLGALKAKSEAAEKAVAAYRERSDLVQGDRASLNAQEISQMATELNRARAERVEAEARLKQAEQALASGGASASSEILASPLIQTLASQSIAAQARAAQLREKYGDRHPLVGEARASLGEMQGRIHGEIAKIVAASRSAAAAARGREEALTHDLDQLKARAGQMGQAEAQLRSLTSEADANRQLFTNLQSRVSEIAVQQNAPEPTARILSMATTPEFPSFPNRKLFLLLALASSSLIGVGLALLLERLDQGFRAGEEITGLTGLPTLGAVPRLGRGARRGRPQDYASRNPRSAFADAIGATTQALLRRLDGRTRLLLVTSTRSREGKSTLAINLARMMAHLGRRTLLIDADLHQPTLHTLLGIPRAGGLSEILAGRLEFPAALRQDADQCFHVLTAGAPAERPLLLIANGAAQGFFTELARHYDTVILDGPPTLAVADAQCLAGIADRTVFVIRWGVVPRRQALLALSRLVEAGAVLAGVVLSMVDTRRHAEYGFGDSGQYRFDRKYHQG